MILYSVIFTCTVVISSMISNHHQVKVYNEVLFKLYLAVNLIKFLLCTCLGVAVIIFALKLESLIDLLKVEYGKWSF